MCVFIHISMYKFICKQLNLLSVPGRFGRSDRREALGLGAWAFFGGLVAEQTLQSTMALALVNGWKWKMIETYEQLLNDEIRQCGNVVIIP